MVRIYNWEFGGSRYEILYGKVLGDDDYFLVGQFDPYNPSRARVMRWTGGYIHWTKVSSELGLNGPDLVAFMEFIKQKGHDVNIPVFDYMQEAQCR